MLSLLAGLLVSTVPASGRLAAAAVSVTQVGAWSFDAGSGATAADSAGSHPLTLGSGASWTSGVRGASALAVDGTSAGNAAATGAVLTTSSSFSVTAYVRLSSVSGTQTIASQDGTTNSAFALQLRSDTGKFGFSRASADTSGASTAHADASTAPVAGQWYHLAGVFNASAGTLALYVNGQLQTTTSTSASWGSTGSFVVGRGRSGGSSTDFLTGGVDDVRAYSGALTAADVEQISAAARWKFDEGSGTSAADASVNGYTATLTNGPTWTAGEIGTNAVKLDGSDDYVAAADPVVDTSKSFSVSAWARLDGGTTSNQVVVADPGSVMSGFYLQLRTDSTWGFVRTSSDSGSYSVTTAASSTKATTGTWFHLVGVYDSVASTMVIYVNGVAQTPVSYSGAWKASGPLQIGRCKSGGAFEAYFNGAIDDVRMYPYALDAGAVSALSGTAPGAPGAPTATAGATSATLTWSAPGSNGGSAVTGYVVTPFRNGTAQAPVTYDASTTTRTLTGLTAGSSYTFTVAATNPIGTSPASAASSAVTPYDVPGAPTAVTATAGTGRATVTWTAPASNGGSAVTGYVVTPYVGTTAQTPTAFASTATTQTVTGLTAGTAYTFKVAAQNAAGVGAQSAASAAVTPNAPPTLTFAAPPAGRVGTAYSTQLTVNDGTAPITWSVSTGTLPAGITLSSGGLLSGTPTTAGTSTFTVRATDASNQSATRSVDLVVSSTTPAAPAAPTAAAGVTSATLTWSAPAANGSTITGYVVTPYLSGTAQTPVSYDASTTTRTLTGLTAGASYTFTLAAVNANGTGPASSPSNAVIPYDVPAAPSISTVTAGDQQVTLSWTTPANNGSPISGYVVTPFIGSTAQTPTTFSSTTTTQTLTGLTAGTAYTFTVAARNAAGTGAQSAASAAVTPNANPTVSSTSPPPGVVGSAYRYQLTTSGGTAPFTWSVTGGSLPSGLTLGADGLLSGTPTAVGSSTFTVQVSDASSQTATRSLTVVVSSKPGTVATPTATAGLSSAVLTWTAPTSNGSAITAYVITPFIAGSAQPTITVDPSAKTRTLNGLTVGSSYTFTVAAVNANGTGTASPASNAVVPYAALSAPTITAVAAGDGSARLSWTAPTSTGGAPVTGYVVTPYIGSSAQTPITFSGTTTTQTITGLTPGTAYTFTVAARNASGTAVLNRVASESVAAVDGGPAWSDNPSYRSGASNVYHPGTTIGSFDGTVPSTTPPGLFSAERWGSDASNEMAYAIPVTSGTPVKVRLYFANTYPGTSSVGARAFDVALEGTTVLPAFDPVAAAGGTSIATMREFAVTSDGTINIAFTHVRDSPAIYGIEIIQTGVATTGPASSASTSVTPNANPTLTSVAPPAGEVGVAYSSQLSATGGTAPFTWSISSGTLPAGLTLSSSGLVSGTPSAAGSFSYTVAVVDASGQTASKAVTQTVAAAPSLTFSPASGEVNVPYSQQPTVSGGTSPVAWALIAGSLPAGVNLDATTGLVSGTPTSSGTFSVTIRVTDSLNQTATRSVSIVIAPAPTLTSTPPSGRFGVGYSFAFTAAGGSGPFSYAVVAGALPTGLSLGSNGTLSGTPRVKGTFPFTVRVTDTNGQTADDAVSLFIDVAPIQVVKTASSASTVAGATVTYTITARNVSGDSLGNTHVYDPLGDVLDDAAYNGDAAISGTPGSVALSGSTLDWAVPLDGGQSSTLTYTVRVANPDTGNKVLAGTVYTSFASTNCAPGDQDGGCSAPVTVSGLSVATTASTTSTTPGSTVTVSTVVTNTGQTPYSAATFNQNLAGVLDDATYNGGATTSSGTLGYASSTLTWTGALAVGASATITYTLTVTDPDTGDHTLTVTSLSSSAGSSCPSGSPGPACTASVTVLVPGLSITNASRVATTTPGSVVPYTVTLANTGQTPYTGASVTVALAGALDDAAYTGGASATGGSVSYSSGAGALVWTGDLAVGASVTISASVTVGDPDTGDRTLTTIASSSAAGSTCPSGSTNAACRTTVSVLVPALTFATTADVTSTTPGSVVHLSVLVTNTGQTAYTDAAFSTSLAGVLDDATYNGDASATSGSVSYAGSTVSWTGALAVGASATVTFGVTVGSPDPGDLNLTSTVVSTTSGSTCRTGSTDPGCSVSVGVLVPGLSLTTVTDAGATATPGTRIRYTTTVLNTGQTTYTGVVVVLDQRGVQDDATFGLDGVESAGTATPQPDGTLRWVLTLSPGQSATATATFRVNDPSTGDKVLSGNVTSSAPGSSCPTASAASSCRTRVDVVVPGVTLSTSTTPGSVTPGDTVSYTVLVRNTGETAYGSVTVTDDLSNVVDDAVYNGDATASSGGPPSYAAPVLTWTGPLALGATTTITFTVTLRDPSPANNVLVAVLASSAAGSNCATGSSDSRCTSTVTVLVPGLTITAASSTPSTVPGATVGYTVKVTNSGATAYTGATWSQSLTGVLDDADYDADATVTAGGGTISYAAAVLSWTGDLAVGASATITYSVTVHGADTGDDRLSSTLTSSSRGSSCPGGGGDAQCATSVPVARLVLTETATESTATPGSVVHLSTTWTNTGQVPYTGISVVSPRADTSDDTTPTGDQTTSSGTLVRTSSAVTWTGDIPVGGSVTGTRTLLVKDPDPGNKVITATLQSSAPGNNCPTSTTDPRCTFTVTVLVPGLSISKVASTTATVPGGTVSYTITAHNTGQTSYPAASLTDALSGVLDDATYDGDASADSGTVSYAAPTLSWTGPLAVDQTVTITYSVTVKAQPGDKTMINPVSSDAAGNNCPAASSDPACRSTVAVLTPALTIVKTADHASATLASTVTYTVTVTNSGQTPYADASFSDPLDAVLDDATYDADATSTPTGTLGYSGSTLTWSGALAPGASATVTYSVTVRDPESGDGSMVSTVVSTTPGSNCPAGGSDSRCTATVALTDAYALTLTKTADVLTTAAGKVVTYTVTALNSSSSPMLGANVSDPLAGIVDDATYDGNATASSGTVSLTAGSLVWVGDVGAGATVTVTYSVTVHMTATGDQILTGQLVSTSPSTSNSCLAGSSDPRCTSTVPVAALVLQRTYAEPTTTPGSVLHASATFTNTGQADYHGITISSLSADTLDDAAPTGDQVASSGSLVLSSTALTWTGDIPVGGSVTVTGTVTVLNPDPGDKRITATLVSSALGNNCQAGSSDPRCTALSVVQVPQLSITTTAGATVAVPGEQVGHTVTVQNTGETPYSGAVVTDTLAGVLDDADYDGDAAADSGVVAFRGSTLTWTGSLAVGQSATITYSVTVRQPPTGDKSMVDTVSSTAAGSTCPPSGGGPGCSSSVDVHTPALTLSTTASSATTVPGASVTYTVTVTDDGQTDYPGGTQVLMPLQGLTDDAAYSPGATATAGVVAYADGVLTWTGGLATGDVVVIRYTVVVADHVTGDHLLQGRATSDAAGSNCADDSPDPRCVATVPVADLHLADATDVGVTQPTGVVHFTETYTNTGQVPLYGVRVTIDTSDAADDAAYNGDARTSSGSTSIDGSTGMLTWTGNLPVGASVISTGSSTVLNPDPGSKHIRTRLSTTDAPSNCPPRSTDPDCVVDVPVLTPGLSIVQTAGTTTTTPGSDVAYTVTVTNTGETAYTGALVSDDLTGVLDDATLRTAPVASSGTVSLAGSTLSWTGDLDVGASATITYGVRVGNPDPGDLTLVGVAASEDLGSTCPAADPGGSCGTVVNVLIPALSIAVVPSTSTTYPAGRVGYTMTIDNSGQTPYTGATVTMALAGVLDDAANAGDAAADVGSVTTNGTDLAWTGDLDAGRTAVVTFSVTVDDPDSGDRVLLATVSSAAAGSTCTPGVPCTSSVVVQVPALSVRVAAASGTTTPGSRVTFTVTLTNDGERPYVGTTTTVSLSDVLDDATFGGHVTASSGVAVYTAPVITWVGNLAVRAQVTLSYTVTVRDPVSGDRKMSPSVRNASAGSPCRTGSVSPACSTTVDVLVPHLDLSVTSSSTTTTPGSVVGYTVVITNSGDTPYAGAVVTDHLDGVLSDADYDADGLVAGGGTLTYDSGGLSWTGDLPVGATVTITYSVTVHDPDAGDHSMLTQVSSDVTGSSCPSGSTSSACSTTVQVLTPALDVGVSADTASVAAGSTVHYTVTVTDSGETSYPTATVSTSLAGVLDDAEYTGDATATLGRVQLSADTLVWSGPLAPGDTATITFSVDVDYPDTGDQSLAADVTSAQAGSSCVDGTELGCSARTAVLVPALSISMTASTTHVVPGQRLTYTVTATNTGQVAYQPAALVDDLGGVLDHATYGADATATRGAVSVSGSTLSWSGDLAVGSSVTVTYSVVAQDVTDGPSAVLANRVTSAALGSSCPAGGTASACSTSTTLDASTLELRDLTPSFLLSGPPGARVSLDDAVVGTVVTNSLGGYSVSVKALEDALTGRQPGNTDTVPTTDVRVRANGTQAYTPLSSDTPVEVGDSDHASAPDGDSVSTDYQVQVPDVASDTYEGTVEYVVSAQ